MIHYDLCADIWRFFNDKTSVLFCNSRSFDVKSSGKSVHITPKPLLSAVHATPRDEFFHADNRSVTHRIALAYCEHLKSPIRYENQGTSITTQYSVNEALVIKSPCLTFLLHSQITGTVKITFGISSVFQAGYECTVSSFCECLLSLQSDIEFSLDSRWPENKSARSVL